MDVLDIMQKAINDHYEADVLIALDKGMEEIERLREVLECVVKYWDEWKSAPDDHLTELSIAALSLEEVVNMARSALKEKE